MWSKEEKTYLAQLALTNMDESYQLDFWQKWYVESMIRFFIINKSRRIGWSYITSLKSVIEAISPNVYRYQNIFVSYGMHDAIVKISDARNALMHLPERYHKPLVSDSKTVLEFYDKDKKSKSQLISLPNRTLRGFGTSNPFGGISLDEFAYHKDDLRVYQSALPCLTRGGLLSIGSTPGPQSGVFYDILTDTKRYPEFERMTIPWWWSSALCIDVVEAMELAPELPTAERVDRWGTTVLKANFSSFSLNAFQQEYECIFIDESQAFISMEMILACTPQEPEQYEYQNVNEMIRGGGEIEICVGFNKDPNRTPILQRMAAPAYDPSIHGILYLGMDMGRTKDASIITVLGVLGDKMHCWMSYEMKNVRFDEQRAVVEMFMSVLPIQRFLIDGTGLGMEFGEWVEKTYPKRAESITFTNEIKEHLANLVYLGFERGNYVLPMNRALHADCYCIRKTTTITKHSRYDGSTKDSHADRFWSLALATHAIGDKTPSKFYNEYTAKKGKDRERKINTGNAELDRIIRRGQAKARRIVGPTKKTHLK